MTETLHNWKPDRQAWLQGVFDTGVRGLLAQGERSFSEENDVCQYRGANGNKCALGMCIPDSKYEPSWDGGGGTTPYITPTEGTAISVAKRSLAIAKALGCETEEEADALRRFQSCHDDAHSSNFIPNFTERAKSFAMRFNLNTDVFDEGASS